MRPAILASALMFCLTATAGIVHAAGQTGTRLAVPPEGHIVLAQGRTSGNIGKECEKKADKQNLKGLTREGYIENCIKTLSFSSDYGTR